MLVEHVLDRPILSALRSRHSAFAEGGTHAFRYPAEVSPFAAAIDGSDEALAALSGLLVPGRSAILLGVNESPLPPNAVAEHVVGAVQMLAVSVTPPEEDFPFLELSDADAAEMLALATLTKPGPFMSRTHDFGGYIGIRVEGRLVAMAGHRLKVPGFIEVSAVCTHPDFRGKGYASFLMRVAAARIQAGGDTPFLHTYAANTGAIKLYETLGFVHRADMRVMVVRRA